MSSEMTLRELQAIVDDNEANFCQSIQETVLGLFRACGPADFQRILEECIDQCARFSRSDLHQETLIATLNKMSKKGLITSKGRKGGRSYGLPSDF